MNLKTTWKMAFRNVWRNKRRTLITGASVMFAVFFASVMEAVQQGAWDNLVHNLVSFHTGYVQIHAKGYWDDQTVNNAIDLESALNVNDADVNLYPRVENFALASLGRRTKGVLIVGTDVVNEDKLTNFTSRVTDGRPMQNQQEIVLAGGLAEYLGASIGDSIVLLSQGRHGTNAAGLFAVAGLIDFGSPDLNNQIAYISLNGAQNLFAMEGFATSLVADLENEDGLEGIKSNLSTSWPEDTYEVMDYKDMLPEIMQAKEFDDLSGRVIILVLYLLIGFGIFGTLLMMLRERRYEFGVLKAIGLKSYQLYGVVWLEMLIIAIGGVLAGVLLSTPIIYYFQENPIQFTGEYAEVYANYGLEAVLPFKFDLTIQAVQGSIVLAITTIMTGYAYMKIKGLRAVNAMRG